MYAVKKRYYIFIRDKRQDVDLRIIAIISLGYAFNFRNNSWRLTFCGLIYSRGERRKYIFTT